MTITSIGYSGSSSKTRGWSVGSISGMQIKGITFDDPDTAGGGLHGFIPNQLKNNSDSSFPMTRAILKESWNTKPYTRQGARILGPFRSAMNAGDTLCRKNYSCNQGSQSIQSRPGLHGIRMHLGGNSNRCVPSEAHNSMQLNTSVPAGTCNGKYVYDASDYTRFLRQQAANRVYDDRSFGGNEYSGSQSALRAIRRR